MRTGMRTTTSSSMSWGFRSGPQWMRVMSMLTARSRAGRSRRAGRGASLQLAGTMMMMGLDSGSQKRVTMRISTIMQMPLEWMMTTKGKGRTTLCEGEGEDDTL